MKVLINAPPNHNHQVHIDVPIPRVDEWVLVHKVGVGEVPLRVQGVTYDYADNYALVLVK